MQPVSRSTVHSFYQAYRSGDGERFAAFLDDDVEWMISGPIDVLRFCGQRHGKAAAVDVIKRVLPSTLKVTGFEPDALLVDGDRVAMLGTLTGVTSDRDRKIAYRVAHFLRFRNDKVVEFRSLIDSFDAAEQVLGHAIDTSLPGNPLDVAAVGDRIVAL